MRTIYYHRTYTNDMLVFWYFDDYEEIEERFIYYTLREALRYFRQKYNLVGKHIKVIKSNPYRADYLF